MRIWHLLFGVVIVALLLCVTREPAGRVGVVIFVMGVIETVLGVTALLALFRTVAAIGYADRVSAYIESVVATIVVLGVASVVMNGVLWAGFWLIRALLE